MRSLAFILIFAILLAYTSFAQQSACDYKIEVIVDGKEFEKEDFKWRMRAIKIEGKSTNITGTAEIKDSSGKTVKSYKPWTSDSISKQKTSSEYSPNLKSGNYEITAEINVDCDDANKDNNVDAKSIQIKGEKEETNTKKSKNEDAKTNEIDTIETINKNKINADEAAQTNQNTIKTKTKKSTANEETENIIQLNKNNQKNQETQSITAYAAQEPQIIYESSGERAKQWIMIFLLTLSVLLNIILIWKR